MSADPAALARALKPVATEARKLPWAKTGRVWAPDTHLSLQGRVPVIDLHDLSVRLALRVLDTVDDLELEAGAVVLITGRGKHTGGRSKLKDAIHHALAERRDAGRLTFVPRGPGRVEVVFDEDRARRARPGMGLVFWLFVALLLFALGVTVLRALGG